MTRYIDFGAVVAEMGRAEPRLVAAATAVYLLSWPVRGLRYRDILAELGFTERTGFLTGAVFISQTGNLVFPARAGDAVRAYVVKVRRGIPYPSGFASLAAERVFDLLTITALAGTVLLGLAATGGVADLAAALAGGVGGLDARSARVAVVVAAAVGMAAVAAVSLIVLTARSDRNRVRPLVARFSADAYADYVAGVIERFAGDIQRVAGTRGAFARVGATSLVVWTLDVFTAALVLAAFDVGLAPGTLLAVCFFAVSVGNLAKVVPLSPGGVGLYEGAFTLLVIGLTPLPYEVAIGAAILDHALKNAVTIVGGVASMVALNVSLLTAVDRGRDRESADAPRVELEE